MPTYKNENTYNSKSFTKPDGGVLVVQPGKTVELNFAVPYADLGLTEVDASSPAIHDKVLVSNSYTLEAVGSQDIAIPFTNRRFSISVVAGSGEIAVLKKAGSTKGIPINDTTGGYMSPEKGEIWAECSSINISSTDGATVTVIVEEV